MTSLFMQSLSISSKVKRILANLIQLLENNFKIQNLEITDFKNSTIHGHWIGGESWLAITNL